MLLPETVNVGSDVWGRRCVFENETRKGGWTEETRIFFCNCIDFWDLTRPLLCVTLSHSPHHFLISSFHVPISPFTRLPPSSSFSSSVFRLTDIPPPPLPPPPPPRSRSDAPRKLVVTDRWHPPPLPSTLYHHFHSTTAHCSPKLESMISLKRNVRTEN